MTLGPSEIKVEGMAEARRQFRRAGDDTKNAVKDANKSAAEKVVRAALPNVPVRTGKLKASVRSLASQTSGRAVAGKAKVPYAAAIHWGEGSGNVNYGGGGSVRRKNRNIRGRPFLWDAADRMLSQVVEEYEGEIEDLLDRTVGGR